MEPHKGNGLRLAEIGEVEESTAVRTPGSERAMIGSQPEEQDAKGAPWGMLFALMAVASALDAIGLNRDLWLDEIYTLVRTVRNPLREIITVYGGDNQHMFFSVLARISVVLFGEHPWTVRLPAVVFGVCPVPALYFL